MNIFNQINIYTVHIYIHIYIYRINSPVLLDPVNVTKSMEQEKSWRAALFKSGELEARATSWWGIGRSDCVASVSPRR